MNITENEKKMITAIAESEYHDADDPGGLTWTCCICDYFGSSAGGILSSLVKKDLAETEGYGYEDRCWLTEKGIETYNSFKK